MITDQFKEEDLQRYLDVAALYKTFDRAQIAEVARQAIRYYSNKSSDREVMRHLQTLETRWYLSLTEGRPDYSVYDDPLFVGDVWACWVVYSRKYVKLLAKTDLKDIESFCDLGCGIGMTTAALKELMPNARGCATNIIDTFQWKVAQHIGWDRGFHMHVKLDHPVDLIFASEYFEHFEYPIQHLREVLRCSPKILVCANAFAAHSVGHFDWYEHSMTGIEVSRAFNLTLREHGYEQLKLGFWNNRPAVWRKV